MILTCPNCETQYFADDSTIGDSGRTVKCTACDHSWFVRPPGLQAEEEDSVAAMEGAHEKYRRQVNARRRRQSRAAAIASWLITATIFFGLGAGAVILRNEVVKIWPQSASAYNFAGLDVNRFGLEFTAREATRTFDGTTPVLTVTGAVENVSRTAQQTPKVRVSLRDEFDREIGYILADIEPRRILSGASGTFQARLENPPVESFSLKLSLLQLGGPRTEPEDAGTVEAAAPDAPEPASSADDNGLDPASLANTASEESIR